METATLPPRKGSATAPVSLESCAKCHQDVTSNGGISGVETYTEAGFEDSLQSVGGHSRRVPFKRLTRLKPALPLSKIRQLTRRSRSSSSGDLTIPSSEPLDDDPSPYAGTKSTPHTVDGRMEVSPTGYQASPRRCACHRKLPTWEPSNQTSPPQKAQAISFGAVVPGEVRLPDGVPVMTRGTTDPISRSFDGVGISVAGVVLPESVVEKEMPRAVSEPLQMLPGQHERLRGRRLWPSMRKGQKSKSESPSGSAKGQREEGRGRSITPTPRLTASRLPSPDGRSAKSTSVGSGRSSPERRGRWPKFRSISGSDSTGGVTAFGKSPSPGTEARADSSELPLGGHERRQSWNASLGNHRMGDCVVKTPPSTLKYGDRLRLWARGAKLGGNLAHVSEAGPPETTRDVGAAEGGGYVGSCDCVHRVHKRLLRRNELAVIGPYEEGRGEFVVCHFTAVDPDGKDKSGIPVHYGDVIMLVDDRNMVWNETVHGPHLAGSLRMKNLGSKKQIAVSFKLPEEGIGPGLQKNGKRGVSFGTDALQIIPEEIDSSRRRRNSKQRNPPLTAYSKKGGGYGVVSGACLCMDGRGDPVFFEVHLANAPRQGDPFPEVTKVTIYPEDEKALSPLPPYSPLLKSGEDSIESAASTAAPSTSSSIHVASAQRPSSLPTHSKVNSSSPWSSTSSLRLTRNGFFRDAAENQSVEHARGLDLPESSLPRRDVPQAKLGAFEGLKWGDYVCFRMPTKDQPLLPEDVVLTMRLSNGMSASLTSKLVKEMDGQGEFPVEARMMKRGGMGDFEKVRGIVYLKCKLRPIVCPIEEEEKRVAARGKADASADVSKIWANGAALWGRELPRMLTAAWQKDGARVSVEEGKGVQHCRVKQATPMPSVGGSDGLLLKRASTWAKRSTMVWLVGVVTILGTGTIVSSVLSVLRNQSPSAPCASIWDLRRPDGSAYPHEQLAAAVAAFEAAGVSAPSRDNAVNDNVEGGARRGLSASGASVASDTYVSAEEEQKRSYTRATSGGSANQHSARNTDIHDRGTGNGVGSKSYLSTLFGTDRAPGSEQSREGPIVATESDFLRATASTSPLASKKSVGNSVDDQRRFARDLATTVVENEPGTILPRDARPSEWALRTLGKMSRTAKAGLSAFLAAITFFAFMMFGLFGWGSQVDPASDVPMQAEVHLMRWDDRTMSEAAEIGVRDTYLDPPNGSDLAPMPHRFLVAENMDVEKAWQRWEATLAWRKENDTDNILSKPHPKFSLIKSKYAHCFHLPDKDGRITYYERPGQSALGDLRKLGVSRQELIEHYIYCMEYLWQVLQPRQTQRITIIIDLAGVKFMDLVGESVTFLKTTVSMMSKHYPQRSFKILILNAPSFFNKIFEMIKPMLNEPTRRKIDLLPVADAGVEMLRVIPPESLPPHYGGECKIPLTESPAEKELLAHTEKILREATVAMEQVS